MQELYDDAGPMELHGMCDPIGRVVSCFTHNGRLPQPLYNASVDLFGFAKGGSYEQRPYRSFACLNVRRVWELCLSPPLSGLSLPSHRGLHIELHP